MSLRIYGNRLLKTLPGLTTRPTPSRVREALFNIWRGRLQGCHWLDLCAGSGAMGAEALCRGAARVIGIDQSSRACGIIRDNWHQVATTEQSFQVLRGDVVPRLRGLVGQTFDCIYFDPPYGSDLYRPVLEAIAQYQLLAQDGELAVEHSPMHLSESALGELTADLGAIAILRQKRYGNTTLTFYGCRPDPS